MNFEGKTTTEAPGQGFLRTLSTSLPGGATTTYQHYGANEKRTNPCASGDTTTYNQGGRPKGKTEPDPDGDGPLQGRRTETVYNTSGDVIATRYNDDPWTCSTYDKRGRITETVVPSIDGKQGYRVTNNYAVNGNPLITSITDDTGTITIENDLLGRTIKYTDASGEVTTSTYDDYGKLLKRQSKLGQEENTYDQYDRLTTYKLDGTVLAAVFYDEYSRIDHVDYANGIHLSKITRDTLGRENSLTYTLANGQTITDSIERFTSGDIKSGIENGVNKQYTYDRVGRLIKAVIGNNTFDYGFGPQDPSCNPTPGYDAGKDGNRTSMSINGVTTTYCYNMADQLIASSDPTLTNAAYDEHGNTISLGDNDHQTRIEYDVKDRATKITAGNKETLFTKDTLGRLTQRHVKEAGQTSSIVNYHYNGAGDAADYTTDANGNIIDKYLALPGNVLLTMRPDKPDTTTYSLSNMHGDIFATTNTQGILNGTFMTGPFGETLPTPTNTPTPLPANTVVGTTFGYVGQHQKITETTTPIPGGIIHMGARLYIPALGRFLQVDPVQGGTDNNYAYVNDPINDFDLNGQWSWAAFVAGVGAGAFCAATAGLGCAVALGLGVGAGVGFAEYAIGNYGSMTWSGAWRATWQGAVLGGFGSVMGYSAVYFHEPSYKYFGTRIRRYEDFPTPRKLVNFRKARKNGIRIMKNKRLGDGRLNADVWGKYAYNLGPKTRGYKRGYKQVHYLKHNNLPIYRQFKYTR
nr:RHS repeat-associated core domain-containing protein [Arcanobacterium pluranimalium]